MDIQNTLESISDIHYKGDKLIYSLKVSKLKTKLKPTRHGKWSIRKQDSIDKKMRLVHELFSLNGTMLENNSHVPEIRFVDFYGNERKFSLDADGNNTVYINKKYLRSNEIDYIILCALCFYYTEKKSHFIKGGKVTMVDLHSTIDLSHSHVKDVAVSVIKNVTAIALTNIVVRKFL